MDSISVKLIRYNGLKLDITTLGGLYANEKEKANTYKAKADINDKKALKWQNIYNATESQRAEEKKIAEAVEIGLKQDIKKARRNGLLYFGGGVVVGVGIIGVLALIN